MSNNPYSPYPSFNNQPTEEQQQSQPSWYPPGQGTPVPPSIPLNNYQSAPPYSQPSQPGWQPGPVSQPGWQPGPAGQPSQPGWQSGPSWQNTSPSPPMAPYSAGPKRTSKVPIILGVVIVIVLIGLGVVGFMTHTYLPASAATITFTPVHQSLNQTYNLSLAQTSDFANNKVAGRQISYTTPNRTKQEKTVNTAHLDPTTATGKLVVIPKNATSSGAIKNMIIHGANGLDVLTDQDPYIYLTPGKATTVPAHISKAGTIGNVGAYFINGNYNPGDDPGLILQVYNPAPFTGGTDGYNGPVVQSSDLTQVTTDLEQQLQQEGQDNLKKQIKATDGLLEMTCDSHITSQPASGSRSANVTASGTVTCKGTVYDQQGVENWVQSDIQQTAAKRFGPHIGLVSKTPLNTTLFSDSLKISLQSDWAVKFDQEGKKALAQSIAGKSQDAARDILMKQFWSQVTNMNLSGWGLYLPSDPSAITFVSRGTTGSPTASP